MAKELGANAEERRLSFRTACDASGGGQGTELEQRVDRMLSAEARAHDAASCIQNFVCSSSYKQYCLRNIGETTPVSVTKGGQAL